MTITHFMSEAEESIRRAPVWWVEQCNMQGSKTALTCSTFEHKAGIKTRWIEGG
jgi:hypothetical protein